MPAPGDSVAGGILPLRFDRLLARPDFQKFVSRLPIARYIARRDGAELFAILQGFVASQVLSALVELGLLRRLLGAPERAEALAQFAGMPLERLEVLLKAAAALKLLKTKRGGRYALARRGAAILGVPGLEAMILHNHAFYADMADPARLLRGASESELSRFWPYAFQSAEVETVEARRYSDLMAQSQALVAHDTLKTVSLRGVTRLMDVGGGAGAFLAEALALYPELSAILVDLPEVAAMAEGRFARPGFAGRVSVVPASFRDGPLPLGADAISLVRVLYDHGDETVVRLLARCFDALPPGGRLVVSEPMSGRGRADPITDVYFAFYTLAMGDGRVRSQKRIAELCGHAGFADVTTPRPLRPYITSVVTCVRPT